MILTFFEKIASPPPPHQGPGDTGLSWITITAYLSWSPAKRCNQKKCDAHVTNISTFYSCTRHGTPGYWSPTRLRIVRVQKVSMTPHCCLPAAITFQPQPFRGDKIRLRYHLRPAGDYQGPRGARRRVRLRVVSQPTPQHIPHCCVRRVCLEGIGFLVHAGRPIPGCLKGAHHLRPWIRCEGGQGVQG